jgi:integrase
MVIEKSERRKSKTLTAAKVSGNLEQGKYHDGGGSGLFLRVEKNGSRRWLQRTTINGNRREIGLGSPPNVSLADARELASQNKRLVREGLNPLAEKRNSKKALTFAEAVDMFLDVKLDEFRNEKHKNQWRSTLATYAKPTLGKLSVSEILVLDILQVLKPIWSSKTETASRLRGRIETVLSWATVSGHREGDNPARWRGNLSELLPNPNKVANKKKYPAMQLRDVQSWWLELIQREAMGAKALQFIMLNASRSGEVRGMTWDELDIGPEKANCEAHPNDFATSAAWIIPAQRMKAKKEHRVALTSEAVALLRSLPRNKNCPLVFPSAKGKQLSDMTISATMRRMHAEDIKRDGKGYMDPQIKRPAVPHGLRSTFRDWAAERGYDRDMAEIQLSHAVGSATERSYRRTDMIERRRSMMEAWGCFLRGEGK